MGRRTRRVGPLRLFALAMLLGVAYSSAPATACAFHTTKPDKTVIDRVVETDHLVIARSDPDDLFRFKVVETLVDGGRTPQIAELVDSTTRRRLDANPEDGVLFAHAPDTGTWLRLAYLTPAYGDVLDRVLAERSNWGEGYGPARFEMFALLQTHPDGALRDLALREIDKAPYELLRNLELEIPVADLLAAMSGVQGYAYRPIRALLLGLSGEDAARKYLRRHIGAVAALGRGTPHLGAFATALIEIDGVDGVERLERLLLADPDLPLATLEQVVEALAIHHGVGADGMRVSISAALQRLAGARPEAAPSVARQFGSRNDWSQAATLQRLVQDHALANTADLRAVAVYVAQARGAGTRRADFSGRR